MSHYHCEVWVPTNKNVEAQVEDAMAPYYEGDNGNGFWDWYQIGDRWKGVHVPGYDQERDPDHIEICRFCNGTGLRPDMGHWKNGKKVFTDTWAEKCNGCNVCHGTGKALKWPTDWAPHPKDIIPLSELPDNLSCYTLVLPEKVIHWEEDFFNKDEGELTKEVRKIRLSLILEEEKITSGYLVTVDYHN